MGDFKQRLDACASAGALSTADLAHWFDLAHATVRSYRLGAEPRPARQPLIEERLRWLEHAVINHPRFPVPLSVRASERQSYIFEVRRDYEQR